jgi:hypothetical protein
MVLALAGDSTMTNFLSAMNALLPVALLQQQALINLCGLTGYRQCFMIQ